MVWRHVDLLLRFLVETKRRAWLLVITSFDFLRHWVLSRSNLTVAEERSPVADTSRPFHIRHTLNNARASRPPFCAPLFDQTVAPAMSTGLGWARHCVSGARGMRVSLGGGEGPSQRVDHSSRPGRWNEMEAFPLDMTETSAQWREAARASKGVWTRWGPTAKAYYRGKGRSHLRAAH